MSNDPKHSNLIPDFDIESIKIRWCKTNCNIKTIYGLDNFFEKQRSNPDGSVVSIWAQALNSAVSFFPTRCLAGSRFDFPNGEVFLTEHNKKVLTAYLNRGIIVPLDNRDLKKMLYVEPEVEPETEPEVEPEVEAEVEPVAEPVVEPKKKVTKR